METASAQCHTYCHSRACDSRATLHLAGSWRLVNTADTTLSAWRWVPPRSGRRSLPFLVCSCPGRPLTPGRARQAAWVTAFWPCLCPSCRSCPHGLPAPSSSRQSHSASAPSHLGFSVLAREFAGGACLPVPLPAPFAQRPEHVTDRAASPTEREDQASASRQGSQAGQESRSDRHTVVGGPRSSATRLPRYDQWLKSRRRTKSRDGDARRLL